MKFLARFWKTFSTGMLSFLVAVACVWVVTEAILFGGPVIGTIVFVVVGVGVIAAIEAYP